MRLRNLWIAIGVVIVIAGGWLVYRNQAQSSSPSSTTTAATANEVAYTCTAGGTALAALEAKYPVDTKDTSYGKQVTGINHVTPSATQFWAFYIDGASATVGADAYQCKGTEAISWKLQTF